MEKSKDREESAHHTAQDVESWSDDNFRLHVLQDPGGFFCKMKLRGKIDLPPEKIFNMLTDPDNHKIFKGIKRVTYRKVLSDDGKGKQVVEVEQEAEWRFLLFRGRFRTRLFVTQDKKKGLVSFTLAKPGLMKKFEGSWLIRPFNQESLNQLYSGDQMLSVAPPPQQQHQRWLQNSLNSLPQFFLGKRGGATQESLIEMEQAVLPNVLPPPPLDRMIKGISARQVQRILDDMRREAKRIKKEEAEERLERERSLARREKEHIKSFKKF